MRQKTGIFNFNFTFSIDFTQTRLQIDINTIDLKKRNSTGLIDRNFHFMNWNFIEI